MLKRVLISVDFPSPDSPVRRVRPLHPPGRDSFEGEKNSPTTMILRLKPFLTLLRCHWFGKLAKPTYPVSFLRTILRESVEDTVDAFESFGELGIGMVDAVGGRSTNGPVSLPFVMI